METKTQLEVGDKILRYYSTEIKNILTIDRVTKTMAFSGTYKFKRDIPKGYVTEVKRDRWTFTSYSLATPEKIVEFNKAQERQKVRETYKDIVYNWSSLTEAQYELLKDTCISLIAMKKLFPEECKKASEEIK